MDPNVTLENARAAYWLGVYDEAAEHFDALDQWLSKGGFLPDSWKVDR